MIRPAYDMPEDGDQLGALVYRSELGAWLYDASYSDPALARRRAESLQRTFGVPFFVQHFFDAGAYAAVSVVYTPQLRSAIFERGKSHS